MHEPAKSRPAVRWSVLLITSVTLASRLAPDLYCQDPRASEGESAEVIDPKEVYQPSPTSAAIDRGLAYLRGAQLPDGSWLSNYGEEGKNTGIVGLATLAFLAAGHEPLRGPYGETIAGSIRFLLQSRHQGMLIREQDTSHGPMYEHGIATLVLGEVVGLIPEDRPGFELLRRVHTDAVEVILKAQSLPKDPAYTGGWRYTPTTDQADLSVTGWQILALRAAQDAGVEVPASSIQNAIAYVQRCAIPSGGFVYDPLQGKKPNPAMSGTGILALELCGEFRSEASLRAGDWLLKNPLQFKTPFFYYSAYYTQQAMYQLGGSFWKDWQRRVQPLLLEKQLPDGSWRLPPGVHEREAGYAYTTSLAILALAVEYRYLPIYQR